MRQLLCVDLDAEKLIEVCLALSAVCGRSAAILYQSSGAARQVLRLLRSTLQGLSRPCGGSQAPATKQDVSRQVIVRVAAGADDRNLRAGDPQRFIVDRTPNNHMAFGRGGPHFCLGTHVAKLQVRILLEEMRKRVAAIELTGPVDRLRSNHVHGIKQLPARFVRAERSAVSV